ncbi:MAG: hypothetical protein PVH93_06235 [Nitrosopumilaceae archaeon]|jgi:uncharacterized protein HemX
MKLSIIVILVILAIGISVISIGALINQPVNQGITTLTPYEKLENYKEELEKINQYNQQLLKDLERQIANSDDKHLEQLKKEIKVLKQVINDNKKELDKVIERLSEMEYQ